MLCVWWKGVGCCDQETNFSAEKAEPLRRLNDHANGFLAEVEGREALPMRRSQCITILPHMFGFFVSECMHNVCLIMRVP